MPLCNSLWIMKDSTTSVQKCIVSMRQNRRDKLRTCLVLEEHSVPTRTIAGREICSWGYSWVVKILLFVCDWFCEEEVGGPSPLYSYAFLTTRGSDEKQVFFWEACWEGGTKQLKYCSVLTDWELPLWFRLHFLPLDHFVLTLAQLSEGSVLKPFLTRVINSLAFIDHIK